MSNQKRNYLTPSSFAALFAMILAIAVFSALSVTAQTTPSVISDEITEATRTAFKLYRDGKHEEALSLATKLSEQAPKDPRPYFTIGAVYFDQGKYKDAGDAYDRAIALDSADKRTYLAKSQAELMQSKIDGALAALRKAIEIDPKYAIAYVMIGDIHKVNEKTRKDAIAAYRTALSIDPTLTQVYTNLALALRLSGDEAGHSDILRKMMEADPAKIEVLFDLGRSLVEQGRLKEARELWEGRGKGEDRTFPNFITVLERAEKLKAATDAFKAKPNDPQTLLAYGYAVLDGDSWVWDGRHEQAIVHFRKALKLRPGFAEAQFAICKAFVEIADLDKSQNKVLDRELAKLKRMDPKLVVEIEEYRKTYKGGLQAAPMPPPSSIAHRTNFL